VNLHVVRLSIYILSYIAGITTRTSVAHLTECEEQRQEYGRLVEETVSQIVAGHFTLRSGIRYPQNGCLSCSHLGLCLNDSQLVESRLVRKAGAHEFDWLDELVD